MVIEELAQAVRQERMREAAEQRRVALALQGQDGTPRDVPSGRRILRLLLPSFVANRSPAASVR